MPKRPRDLNQLAKMVVEIASGEVEDTESLKKRATSVRGRAGGLAGGNARAAAIPHDRAVDIARLGAEARWKKGKP